MIPIITAPDTRPSEAIREDEREFPLIVNGALPVSPRCPLPDPEQYETVTPEQRVQARHDAMVARAQVARGEWPAELMARWQLPERFEDIPDPLYTIIKERAEADGITPSQAFAEIVKMDDPGDIARIVADWLATYSSEADKVDLFAEKHHARAYVYQTVAAAIEWVFRLKATHRRERPGQEASAKLGCEVRHQLQPFAHPGHDSDPAGHGGYGGGEYAAFTDGHVFRLLWIPEELWAMLTEILLLIFGSIAMARTFAYMHDEYENADGFMYGMQAHRHLRDMRN